MTARAVRLAAVALAAALVLAGCSGPAFTGGGTGGQGGSGGQSGSDQGGSNQGGDDVAATDGSDGDAEPSEPVPAPPSTTELPADWPAELVVPDGDILNAVGTGAGGWVALIAVADKAAAFAEASATIKAAGYTVLTEVAGTNGDSVGVYENAQYQVQIAATGSPDEGYKMSYTITTKG